MPELPEVETIRRGLSQLIVGKVIAGVTHDTPKSFPNAAADVEKFLIGAKIVLVARRAKVLLIELDTKYTIVTHLKMTGQLVYEGKGVHFGAGHPSDSLVGEMPDTSTRVIFTFKDDTKLFFNDQRKFGWMKLFPTAVIEEAFTGFVLEAHTRKQRVAEQAVREGTVREQRSDDAVGARERLLPTELGSVKSKRVTDAVLDFMKKVGPEPLEADFTWQVMRDRLQRRKNTNIKAVLLDQTVIAGVGNIYADESLWGAKIHPSMLVKNLSDARIKLLHKSLLDILQLSIDRGGSTDKHYVDAEGKKGSYLTFANVFRREGKPCSRCGTTIIKTRVAGRGTHLCPTCQKEPT